MKHTTPYHITIALLAPILLFTIDQSTKKWAVETLSAQDIFLLPGFARLSLHYNDQLALSIAFPRIGQILLSLILLIGLIYYFLRVSPLKNKLQISAFSLIIGGALGNLFDRIVSHKVTDFIALWKFPVFNLADTFIFIGVCLFLMTEMKEKNKIL